MHTKAALPKRGGFCTRWCTGGIQHRGTHIRYASYGLRAKAALSKASHFLNHTLWNTNAAFAEEKMPSLPA